MANPNWKKNGTSPNPNGRPKLKHSVRTVKGMCERFLQRNITPNKLQVMYDGLSNKDKLQFLLELLPYCAAKQSALSIDSHFAELSDGDIDKLYNRVIGSLSQPIQLDDKTTLLPANFNRYGQE